MRRATMRTFVYVDGFNLYYGALRGTPWKWLDLPALFAKVLQPRHDILKVKYFTARVSGTASDPSKPQRQDVYLRALRRYRPEVEVYFGHFLTHRVRAALAQPVGDRRTVEVIRTEEKGSDVNLAVHLLNDGWLDACDCAVVVSNDSDIAEAMRPVKEQHGKRIGLVTSGTRRPSSSSWSTRTSRDMSGRARYGNRNCPTRFPEPASASPRAGSAVLGEALPLGGTRVLTESTDVSSRAIHAMGGA